MTGSHMSRREPKEKNLQKNESLHLRRSRRILRVEKNKNSKNVDNLFTRIGVELVSKIVVQRFNLKRWRKEENEQRNP